MLKQSVEKHCPGPKMSKEEYQAEAQAIPEAEQATPEAEQTTGFSQALWPPWRKKTEAEQDYLAKYERWIYRRQQEREFREQYEVALDYNTAHIGQHLASSWQDRITKWAKAARGDKWKPDLDLGTEVLQELMKRVEEDDKKRSETKTKAKGKEGPLKNKAEAPYTKVMVEKDNKTLHQRVVQSLQTKGAAACERCQEDKQESQTEQKEEEFDDEDEDADARRDARRELQE